jgi:hypothetical protein
MSLNHTHLILAGVMSPGPVPVPLDPIPTSGSGVSILARQAADGLTAKVREDDEGSGVASAFSSIALQVFHVFGNTFQVRVQGRAGRENTTFFSAWYPPSGSPAQTLPFTPNTGQTIYTNSVRPNAVQFVQDGVAGSWLDLSTVNASQEVIVSATASITGGQGTDSEDDTRDIQIWLRSDGYADTPLVTFRIQAYAFARAFS